MPPPCTWLPLQLLASSNEMAQRMHTEAVDRILQIRGMVRKETR